MSSNLRDNMSQLGIWNMRTEQALDDVQTALDDHDQALQSLVVQAINEVIHLRYGFSYKRGELDTTRKSLMKQSDDLNEIHRDSVEKRNQICMKQATDMEERLAENIEAHARIDDKHTALHMAVAQCQKDHADFAPLFEKAIELSERLEDMLTQSLGITGVGALIFRQSAIPCQLVQLPKGQEDGEGDDMDMR